MLVKYPYSVDYQDGKFFIQFKDWVTGFTEADTEDQIPNAAKEVLELLIEEYRESGLRIPKASSVGSNRFVETSV